MLLVLVARTVGSGVSYRGQAIAVRVVHVEPQLYGGGRRFRSRGNRDSGRGARGRGRGAGGDVVGTVGPRARCARRRAREHRCARTVRHFPTAGKGRRGGVGWGWGGARANGVSQRLSAAKMAHARAPQRHPPPPLPLPQFHSRNLIVIGAAADLETVTRRQVPHRKGCLAFEPAFKRAHLIPP